MPKVWSATVEEHRVAVRQAILEAAWSLARERGPLSLTMSLIAKTAGIGRATLYKYFPDVDAILLAYHQEQVAHHLAQLHHLPGHPASAMESLEAALMHYATVVQHREQPSYDAVRMLLHADPAVDVAHRELIAVLVGMIEGAVKDGQVRRDLDPQLMADFCVSALGAASSAASAEDRQVLVKLILDSLRTSGGSAT